MKKNGKQPEKSEMKLLPAPLPGPARDFIRAVAPAGTGPAEELTARFRETRAREQMQSLIVPTGPKSGPEYLVELRIREWMYRMEREAAQNRQRAAETRKREGHPPQNAGGAKPPAP